MYEIQNIKYGMGRQYGMSGLGIGVGVDKSGFGWMCRSGWRSKRMQERNRGATYDCNI